MAHIHREPYITLAALTSDAALITWGAFFFEVTGQEIDGRFKIIEDKDLQFINPPRETSIGESSNFYGPATVRVREKNSGTITEVNVSGTTPDEQVNHAWVRGLRPDTEYEYELTVKGEPWATEERRDWVVLNDKQGMLPNKGIYQNVFRTYPREEQPAPEFTFAVIGDYGRGVRKLSTDRNRQREIAVALEQAVREKGVRFVLTTGDNIYSGGGADSDWFFTHYQPYRYILNRVPFYPACGNHDTDEQELSDDYKQLLDNFYIRQRFFSGNDDEGNAVKDNGLFYNFNFGSDVEFLAIDSAKQTENGPRAFQKDVNKAFIREILPSIPGPATSWRIPFFHHPPYVDGPLYTNFVEVINELVQPIFEHAGVRLVFNGHEHNLQISKVNEIHYVVTGSAGDLRADPLLGDAAAGTIAWAPAHHFLLVEYKQGAMHVTPYGELNNGQLAPLSSATNPQGQPFEFPLVVTLA